MELNVTDIENLPEIDIVNADDKFIVFRKNENNKYESYHMSAEVLDDLLVKRDVLSELIEKLKSLNDKYLALESILDSKFITEELANKSFLTKTEFNNAQKNLISKTLFTAAIDTGDKKLTDQSLINYYESNLKDYISHQRTRIMSSKHVGWITKTSIKKRIVDKAAGN